MRRAAVGDEMHPIGLEAIADCATLDPLADTEPLVWGWDVGQAQSWTAGVALDECGQVCRVERFKLDWDRTFRRIAAAMGAAVALVDATPGSVGDPILTWLQQDGPEGLFLPFQFTAQTRDRLLVELAATIQRGEVSLPRDGQLRAELEALEWQATASHLWRYGFPSGMSGDLVMHSPSRSGSLSRRPLRDTGGEVASRGLRVRLSRSGSDGKVIGFRGTSPAGESSGPRPERPMIVDHLGRASRILGLTRSLSAIV